MQGACQHLHRRRRIGPESESELRQRSSIADVSQLIRQEVAVWFKCTLVCSGGNRAGPSTPEPIA